MNILASVYDKTGLSSFLNDIKDHIGNLYATGRTLSYLQENRLPAISTAKLSGFDELLGGRVKTLVPGIFAGILARRDEASLAELKSHGFMAFDMVISNLYPFAEAARSGSLPDMIENIDIGGVSLIRAAAKNFENVTILTSPTQYAEISAEIRRDGNVSEGTRKNLAIRAFDVTTAYDSLIHASLSKEMHVRGDEGSLSLSMRNGKKLRYGENPNQGAIMFPDGSVNGIPNAEFLGGKELSYNNILDSNAAYETALEFDDPTIVIVKHLTPCGVASDSYQPKAYEKAFAADPESAYGFVLAANTEISGATAELIAKNYAEVVVAPSYTEEAIGVLRKKKNLRILRTGFLKDESNRLRSVSNGILTQTPLSAMPVELELKTAAKASPTMMQDLLFAWKVVAHCRSNAIALAKEKCVTGIGGGQTSRVRALRIAGEIAGDKANGSVLASDAFFPFADNVEEARRIGVSAIIQPGGSIRDKEVIEKCEEYSLPLYFTGKRVFLH